MKKPLSRRVIAENSKIKKYLQTLIVNPDSYEALEIKYAYWHKVREAEIACTGTPKKPKEADGSVKCGDGILAALKHKYPVGIVGVNKDDCTRIAFRNSLHPRNRNECVFITSPEHFRCHIFSRLIISDMTLSPELQKNVDMAIKLQLSSFNL